MYYYIYLNFGALWEKKEFCGEREKMVELIKRQHMVETSIKLSFRVEY